MPVASNVFGSLDRMCLALGVRRSTTSLKSISSTPQVLTIMGALKMLPMVGRLRDLMPKTVKDARCQEIVRRDGTLATCQMLARGRRTVITLPLVFTKDPETGMRNIGTYRMQVFDNHQNRRRTGSGTKAARKYRVAERLGRRLDGRCAQSRAGADVLRDGAHARGLDELILGGWRSAGSKW
jgi:4-hydroxy-3-polyprenylbenzoate decarboxylase